MAVIAILSVDVELTLLAANIVGPAAFRFSHYVARRFESRVAKEAQLYFEAALDCDGADEAVRGACTWLVLSFCVMNDLFNLGRNDALHQLSGELVSAYKDVPNKTKL